MGKRFTLIIFDETRFSQIQILNNSIELLIMNSEMLKPFVLPGNKLASLI
jgi:hypothetical protein